MIDAVENHQYSVEAFESQDFPDCSSLALAAI